MNQTIECSANHYGGSTSLHLALNTNSKRHFGLDNQLRLLDLLLKYNADVGAEDDHGYTPLHVAADCDPSCVSLLQKLIEYIYILIINQLRNSYISISLNFSQERS